MSKLDRFILIGDWLKNLIDRAILIDPNESEFNEGLQQGYYESISHIINQIDGLNLKSDLNDEYLENFEPEDIINGKAKQPFAKEEDKS